MLADAVRVLGVCHLLQYSVLVRHSRLCAGTHTGPPVTGPTGGPSAAAPSGLEPGSEAALPSQPYDLTPGREGQLQGQMQNTPSGIAGIGGAKAAASGESIWSREKLKMYALPHVRLKALVEARAAEGFQATAIRLGGSVGQLFDGMGMQGSSGKQPLAKGGRKFHRISDSNVLLRLCRHFHHGLSISYTLEYEPLLLDLSGLGSVNVTLDVVGLDDYVRLIKDPSLRGPEDLRTALRRFLRALQDVDLMLFRVISLLKPRGPPPGVLGREEDGRFRELLWLGQVGTDTRHLYIQTHSIYTRPAPFILPWSCRLCCPLPQVPVSHWKRWLRVEYMEVAASSDALYDLPILRDWPLLPPPPPPAEDPRPPVGPPPASSSSTGAHHDAFHGDLEAMDALVRVLDHWSTHHAGRNLFWKLLPPDVGDDPEAGPGPAIASSYKFLLVRLTWLSPFVACLCLGAFGVKAALLRQEVWRGCIGRWFK